MKPSAFLMAFCLVLGITGHLPATAGVVTNGLIGGHDPALYNGDRTWEDVILGDGYDATGTLTSTKRFLGQKHEVWRVAL